MEQIDSFRMIFNDAEGTKCFALHAFAVCRIGSWLLHVLHQVTHTLPRHR